MKFNVITIGGITEDIMFHTQELQILNNPKKTGARKLFAFEVGDKIISDCQVLYTGGGGGANTAVSLARLGLKTALWGAVGDDSSAQKLAKHFAKNKINLSGWQVNRHDWTGLSFIIIAGDKNDRVIFTHRGANDRFKLSFNDCLKFQADWFYLTSLSGIYWQANLAVVFAAAEKNKVKLAWNPGSTQLDKGYAFLKKYLSRTEVLTLNKEEAAALVRSAGKRAKDIKQMLEVLASFGPKIVGISNGNKGAHAYATDRFYFEPAWPVKAINTTGAGDAFGSSLVGGLMIYRGNLARALKLALLRSGCVVAKIGAQTGLLTLAEVKQKRRI
ncbi:MAG: carbohydrate kinase family protein [Candidatus Komeilibacteria bacterium]|nr:carbohydrate kinase family protein [Candidatus Komeilibacteria bacterium]